MPKIIRFKFINIEYNDSLAGYFGINKTKKLIGQKYYSSSLRKDVKTYIKSCDVFLALKMVRHKPYNNLQTMLILTHHQKDLLIDFVIGFSISTNQKGETYNMIIVIVNRLTKMICYKPVRININAPGLVKVIFHVVV